VRVSEGAVKKSRMRENFKSGSVREGASPMGMLSLYSTIVIPGQEEIESSGIKSKNKW
jgi:hypothetical protein